MATNENEINNGLQELHNRILILCTDLGRRQERGDRETWISEQLRSCHRLLRDVEEVKAKLRLQESQYEKLSNKILPNRRSREQDNIWHDIRLMWTETSIVQSSMSIHDSRTLVVRNISNHARHTFDKLAQVNQEIQNGFHHMTNKYPAYQGLFYNRQQSARWTLHPMSQKIVRNARREPCL